MSYPPALYLCAALLLGLLIEACIKIRRPWSIPAIGVYLTTLGWYFVDPFQSPEDYAGFPPTILSLSYFQVALFLLAFRWLVPRVSGWSSKNLNMEGVGAASPNAEKLFKWLVILWVPLVLIGIMRMEGDVVAALFPLDARGGTKGNMWSRGAMGGTTDFLISTGGYIYQLVCGLLGVTLVLQRNGLPRFINAGLFLLSIPFFLFSGARSFFIAAIAPAVLCYLVVGRQKFLTRALVTGVSFVGIYFLLLTVIENRATGFRYLVDEEAKAEKDAAEIAAPADPSVINSDKEKRRTQQGLNMIQELCFINEFSDSGTFQPAYGGRYLIELTNMIPRALWPDKPMIGIDYAVWRGFGGADTSTGVFATISTGMIGGGVMNFGKWIGPPIAGLLIAMWAGLLSRWWQQRYSLLRLCLFMAGLGLTFNMGRDITLLVLWPVVFAYLLVRLAEKFTVNPGSSGSKRPTGPQWKTRKSFQSR